MSPEQQETIWLHFVLAYVAATKEEYEAAHDHAQKALDLIVEFGAKKKLGIVAEGKKERAA